MKVVIGLAVSAVAIVFGALFISGPDRFEKKHAPKDERFI